MFVFCRKCGLIKMVKTHTDSCPICDSPLFAVPDEYLTQSKIMFKTQNLRQKFENELKSSPDYDETIASQKDIIIAKKEEAHKKVIEEKVSEYKSAYPKKCCPVCNSTSLSKISNVGKVAKIGAFGILGAGDLGKTWKCNNCGTKF